MIKYLPRELINIEKYDTCISNAFNARIYAHSWYLDIITDAQWDVLVLGDYEAVMPLPKRRKYFINYIFLAPWCQQLGVFSTHKIDSDLVQEFLKNVPKKFKLVETFLNTESKVVHSNIKERINYVLPLNLPYETLHKSYSKGRKSSVKKARSIKLSVVDNYDYKPIIDLFKEHKGKAIETNVDYNSLSALIKHGLLLKLVICLGVTNENNELIGGALFFKYKQRITYLFSSVNDEGRKKQAMSLLLDCVIQKFSDDYYILDFEGSMMPKVALFFTSFGSEKEIYYHYKKYSLL